MLMDRNAAGLEAVAGSIGRAAGSVVGDVTEAADITAAVAATTAHGGQLDIVVNNAGWSYPNQTLLDTTEEQFDRVFAVNVKSIFHMVTAAVPVMRMAGEFLSADKLRSDASLENPPSCVNTVPRQRCSGITTRPSACGTT